MVAALHWSSFADTVRRLFVRLDPTALQECFFWVEAVREVTKGDIVAIDGKTVRRSSDRAKGKLPIHLVSAWAVENGLVLGQVATEEHSNEITAIPALLDMLKIKGCIVTIDAEGCQTAIAEKISKEKKADYVLAVKGNQPNLEEQIKDFFADSSLPSRVDRVTQDSGQRARAQSIANFVTMRRMALGLVKRDTASKKSLRRRRRMCLLKTCTWNATCSITTAIRRDGSNPTATHPVVPAEACTVIESPSTNHWTLTLDALV